MKRTFPIENALMEMNAVLLKLEFKFSILQYCLNRSGEDFISVALRRLLPCHDLMTGTFCCHGTRTDPSSFFSASPILFCNSVELPNKSTDG